MRFEIGDLSSVICNLKSRCDGAEVEAGEFFALADNEAAVAEGGGGAAHGVDADSGELMVGLSAGGGEADVAAVVFEHDDFAVGQKGRGDGAVGGFFPIDLASLKIDALMFFTAIEVHMTFVDDGGAAVAAGDPEVGPGGFGWGVFLVLGGAETDAIGTAVEDQPIAAGDGGGLTTAFDRPEFFACGGVETQEGVVGGVEDEGGAGVGLPPLRAAGVAFGFFLLPQLGAGFGVEGEGGAGADEDFAIGDEWGGGGAFAWQRGFPDFFAVLSGDAIEVGAASRINVIVNDGGGAGGVAADGQSLALVAPDLFAAVDIEANDDVVGLFDGVGDSGEEFFFESLRKTFIVHPLAEGIGGREGFALAFGDFVELSQREGGAAGFEAGGGPGAEGDALFFGHVFLDPLGDPLIELFAAQPWAEVEPRFLKFLSEFWRGAAVVELLHDFSIDFSKIRRHSFMPDDAHIDAFASDDGAAVAAVVVAGDRVAFPEFHKAGLGNGLGNRCGIGGDAAAIRTPPLGPVR